MENYREMLSAHGWVEGIYGVFSTATGGYTIDLHSKVLTNPDGYREHLSSINSSLLEAIGEMDRKLAAIGAYNKVVGLSFLFGEDTK